MEARVLRAALSAAIRVTVSTTLIGCGGRVGTDFPDPEGPQAPTTTDASQGNHGSGGTYASSPDHATPSAGTYGTPSAQAGQPQVSQGGTGMAVATGGAPSEEAGAAGAADSPEAVCGGPKTQMCLAHMESIEEFLIGPEDKVALDCCQTVLNPIPFIEVEPGCENELIPRLEAQRYRCCRVLDTFEGGCSPWGPPVPPELSGALLQTWLRVAA